LTSASSTCVAAVVEKLISSTLLTPQNILSFCAHLTLPENVRPVMSLPGLQIGPKNRNG